MENFSEFYPMIVDCAVGVAKVIIAIVFGVIIIPWVKKNAIPWLKDKQLYGVIQKFVRAAEKLGEAGTISKDAKLDYVIGLLNKRGVNVTADVRAMIESAVGDLDDEISHGMMSLVEALNTAGDIDNIVIDGGKATVSVEAIPAVEGEAKSAE